MKLEEYGPLVEALLPAVLAAGRIEMRHFAAGVEVETKADTTPVTIADHEAEEVLTEGAAPRRTGSSGDRRGSGGGRTRADDGGRVLSRRSA